MLGQFKEGKSTANSNICISGLYILTDLALH